MKCAIVRWTYGERDAAQEEKVFKDYGEGKGARGVGVAKEWKWASLAYYSSWEEAWLRRSGL